MKITKSRIAGALLSVAFGFLVVDHFFGPAAQQRKLYEPISKYEAPSSSSLADFAFAQKAAAAIKCEDKSISFVPMPTSSNIQVVGITNDTLLQVAGQLATFKMDVVDSKALGFDTSLGCKTYKLGGSVTTQLGKWKNTATSPVVFYNKFAVPTRIVPPNQSTTFLTGETAQVIF
jgi:hypothetical protein